ncbi:MAG: ATP synthase F1 subunit epsilon [Coriobacteriales bacterium]|jgi:F-type H+-transporting ATPase subunit epsilon|nr:ATP synthase F1 subunit epsilon [Coriobacteriales bacterium]
MAQLMTCDIVTPEGLLFSGEAEYISAPAAEGGIGFMYQCAPFMSTLKKGAVRIKKTMDSDAHTFAVGGGYVEVDGRKVVVLASHAIDMEKVDIAISQERIELNEQRLAELADDDSRAVFVRQEIDWHRSLIELKQDENKGAV